AGLITPGVYPARPIVEIYPVAPAWPTSAYAAAMPVRATGKRPEDILSIGVVSVGIKELLAVDLISGDCGLSLRRNEPINETLAGFFFNRGMLFRVHQHHAVLIEQSLIAFDEDDEIAAILERQPCAAIGKHVGVRR